jgi:hypothetical protein
MTEMHGEVVPRDYLPLTVRGTALQGPSCLRFGTGEGPATVRVRLPEQTGDRPPVIDVRLAHDRREYACSPQRANALLTAFELYADTLKVARAEDVIAPAARALFDLIVALMTKPAHLQARMRATAEWFWLAAARPDWWDCCTEEGPHAAYAGEPEMLRHAVDAWRRAVWLDPEPVVEPRDDVRVHDTRFECGARMRVIARHGHRRLHGRDARLAPDLVREIEARYAPDQCPPLVFGRIDGKLVVVPARNLRLDAHGE